MLPPYLLILNQVTPDASWQALLVLVGAIVSVVGVVLTAIPVLRAWRKRRKLLNKFFTRDAIKNATRCYVKPHCSELDLSDCVDSPNSVAGEDEFTNSDRMNLFKKIDCFLRDGIVASSHEPLTYAPLKDGGRFLRDGIFAPSGGKKYKHMLLLADSGMGKTSFLLNYYALNRRRLRGHRIALIPLGPQDALLELEKIESKNETVLFLDAFDEDPEAPGDYIGRLDTLMKKCETFERVLITARTQFFPKESEIPSQTRTVLLTPHVPGGHTHEFAKLYLAPFSEEQVDQFLDRRYSFFYRWPKGPEEKLKKKVDRLLRPIRFLWRKRQRTKARSVVDTIDDLRKRPLLLAYIPYVLKKASQIKHSHQLYEIVVDYWYEVEEYFWRDKDAIRRFSEEIAVKLYLSGGDRMKREDVVEVAQTIEIRVDEWKTTARSLLNRDAQGNYKFAHQSIMEYLFVKKFVEGDSRCCRIRWTDQMKKFMLEMIAFDQESKSFAIRDIHGADLEEAQFALKSLKELSLPESNLKKVRFSPGCDLQDASFSGSDLEGASLYKAILTGANLSKANLPKADLRFADLTTANLEYANLENAHLESANLENALLMNAIMPGCDLQRAKCKGANLENAILRGAKLGGWGVDMGADLRDASLKNTDLTGAVLTGAKMQGANLSGSIVTWDQIVAARTDPHTIVDQVFRQRQLALLRGELSRDSEREVREALLGISNGGRPASDLSVTYRESYLTEVIQVRGAGSWYVHRREDTFYDSGICDSQQVRELVKTLIELVPWKHGKPGESQRQPGLTIEVCNLKVIVWERGDPRWLVQIRDQIIKWTETKGARP
jgi:uncharacterized protein YjbI with pentapeptide repeats